MNALVQFAKAYPKLLVPHLESLHVYLGLEMPNSPEKSDRAQKSRVSRESGISSVLKVLELSAPFSQLGKKVVSDVEQGVTHLVNKGTQHVFTTAVDCLCALTYHCSGNLGRVSKILLMCTGDWFRCSCSERVNSFRVSQESTSVR